MPCVANGLYVVQGEMAILLAAMRRGNRWSSNSQDYHHDVLSQGFNDLKDVLNQLGDLKDLDPSHYFGPFLEVIRAGGTTGPVTSIALSAVQKFLSYGLVEASNKTTPSTLENIADAVTHTKFVSTDQNGDGVVLLKIVQVLRTLVLSPLGALLTHESMCEIMLSSFRICFEHRLTEHIRKAAEFCLRDIVQHLFTRLAEFPEDGGLPSHVKKIKMNKGSVESSSKSIKKARAEKRPAFEVEPETAVLTNEDPVARGNIVDMQGDIHKDNVSSPTEEAAKESTPCEEPLPGEIVKEEAASETPAVVTVEESQANPLDSSSLQEYVNPHGVRFKSELLEEEEVETESPARLVPYGLSWIRELFRFLLSLCNPLDKMNSELMIHVGLTLLEVAFEVGGDNIGRYSSLLILVKDELCRNLFSLLNSDRLSIFALDIQVCFLMFEALRTHLKFQLESFLTRLAEMIVSDSVKITFEQKEIALEAVVQLWRVPGLVTELYLNYDCDLYCSNLFEDITKLLSKNAFPVTGIYSTHLLSLDALLTIIDAIEDHCHNRILSERQSLTDGKNADAAALPAPHARAPRHPVSHSIPSHEQLMAIKRKKKLLNTGTEQFNVNPKKGIQFLQEHHLLKPQLDPQEVVFFLRENPRLDKKMIGEYISNRSNIEVLEAFVKSFDFSDMRIDEALRLYLETFRLPGESPLISMIMEYFADAWHKSNGEPFVNADAAFTLAYAVIMLNVDQHNHNVKRQSQPMSPDQFKRNLKAVNGGKDFDQDLLDEIYNCIKNEEIVMPAEQSGLVKENYLWKVLLRRGAGKDGTYLHAPNGLYDHDLFSLIFSPTIAALSFVFDKSSDPTIYQKAISGFRKCAMISAHYGMSSDFDNIIVSLCKFSNLTNSLETPDQLTISFGANPKVQLAAKTLFNLTHRHGDILREGWTNILDIILVLYRSQLLPKCLTEAEDFLEAGGKIQLVREEAPTQKAETGLLSSLYSYIALGEGGKAPSLEEQEAMRIARQCIKDCRVEQIVTESKFLRVESLTELVKALIAASPEPSSTTRINIDTAVFFLEMLLKVVIQNRDRGGPIWPLVRDHLYSVMMGGSACENHFLTERAIVGLLRLAIRLMRREDMSPIVLQSLRMLLLLKPGTLHRVARQVAYGLNALIKSSAANIHTTTDWTIIFTLLECVGAGSPPPRVVGDTADQGSVIPWAYAPHVSPRYSKLTGETKSDGDFNSGTEDSGVDRGYTSEPEPGRAAPAAGGWILVGRAGELQPLHPRSLVHFDVEADLQSHDPFALVKCCETLAFLVRDVAHITPFNYRVCVQCIRIFAEASLSGANKKSKKGAANNEGKSRKKSAKRREGRSPQLSPTIAYDADESDSEEFPSGYHQITIQLLDLMHTLHTRTAQIHRWWAEEGEGRPEVGSLWQHGWCPLLQGIARLCCDSRKQVRMTAITYLQRALLVHDLQTLNADEWESCFNEVLFPLLGKLLELEVPDEAHLEETRVRAATVLSKVFLHHLTPLLSLSTFTALWLRILDIMDKYMHIERSDLLLEAIPESLKNMILVMDSAQVFSATEGYSPLWQLTWDRISTFLPDLQEEFFKAQSSVPKPEETHGVPAVPKLPSPPVLFQKSPENTISSGAASLGSSPPDHMPVQIGIPIPANLPTYDINACVPNGAPSGERYPDAPQTDYSPPYQIPIPIGVHSESEGLPTIAPVPISLCGSGDSIDFTTARPTSIILQPPAYGQTYTTPIFNHTGQQMKTTVIAANPVTLVPHTEEAYSSLPPFPAATSSASPPLSSPRFGSHPSAFVPYVNPSSADSPPSLASPVSPASSPPVTYKSPEKHPLPPNPPCDSVVTLELGDIEPVELATEPSASPPVDNIAYSPAFDDIPFRIPATSNITAPVQMFSGSHLLPSFSNPLSPNNNMDPTTATSMLSQYFNASYQNQQQDAFDNILASVNSPKHQ